MALARRLAAPLLVMLVAGCWDLDSLSSRFNDDLATPPDMAPTDLATPDLVLAHCSNGMLDETLGETDVDCGGSCGGCALGKMCKSATDCLGGVCGSDGKCALGAPVVTSVDPRVASTAGNVTVKIKGANFGMGGVGATVRIAGKDAMVTPVSDEELDVVLPQNLGWYGAAPVTVTNSLPMSTTASDVFAYFTATPTLVGLPPVVATDSGVVALVGADFTGDGKLDLVTATIGSGKSPGNVACWAGAGDGSFKLAGTPLVHPAPSGLAAGKVLGANTDLVMATGAANTVAVYPGDGSCGFDAAHAREYAVGTMPTTPVLGDFNGDGKIDIAVADTGSSDVAVLLQNANGGFTAQPRVALGTGKSPVALVAADLDGDGVLDLAVADKGDDTVALHKGNGMGGFAPGGSGSYALDPGLGVEALAVADVNGDGKPDLVVGYDAPLVSVVPASGPFTFATRTDLKVARGTAQVAVADFNQDGLPDLAALGVAVDVLTWIPQKKGGGWDTPVTLAGGPGPAAMVVGNIDTDGNPDVAVADRKAPQVEVMLWRGHNLQAAVDVPANPAATSDSGASYVAVADVDGDGNADLVTPDAPSQALAILAGARTGAFRWPSLSPSVGPVSFGIAVADVTGDGKPDLVAPDPTDGVVKVVPSDTSGWKPANSFMTAAPARRVVVGLVDGDNIPDIVALEPSANQVEVFFGDGTGMMKSKTVATVGVQPVAAAIGDIDRDGKHKVVVVFSGDGTTQNAGGLAVLDGDNGKLSLLSQTKVEGKPAAVALADFTGDGLLDAAVATGFTAGVAFLVNGDGTFTFAKNLAVCGSEGSPVDVTAFDLDGNQVPDVLAACTSPAGGLVGFALRSSDATSWQPIATPVSVGNVPDSIAVGVLTNAQRPDVAVGFADSPRVRVLANVSQ